MVKQLCENIECRDLRVKNFVKFFNILNYVENRFQKPETYAPGCQKATPTLTGLLVTLV
jgi:hypothetical protein